MLWKELPDLACGGRAPLGGKREDELTSRAIAEWLEKNR